MLTFLMTAVLVLLIVVVVLLWTQRNTRQDAGTAERLRESEIRSAGLAAELAATTASREAAKLELDRTRTELRAANTAAATAREELASVRSELNKELEARATLPQQFAATAAAALRANNSSFLDMAQERFAVQQKAAVGELETRKTEIDGLLRPIGETLTRLDKQVFSMREQEAVLLTETKRLASALRETKVRGNWGELQLKRIAELAGMQEHCDFHLQRGVLTDEQQRLYPDMTVQLPNRRVIVVDSKAVMTAYADAAVAEDADLQQRRLADHARAVRQRVDELSGKDYRRHVSDSADFVVCFIPGEAFFSAAVAADPELLDYAADRNVILASPVTLLTILRAVALGWKEVRAAEEARNILETATTLYERLRTSMTHVAGVGSGLQSAVDRYNKFVASVETRVFPQARRLKDLGTLEGDLADLDPVETAPRPLAAPDWAAGTLPSLVASTEDVDAMDKLV